MKKVGIYSRDWGKTDWKERWVGSIARILSEDSEVEILYHQEGLDPKNYAETLGLDLSRISFRAVPLPEKPDWSDCKSGTRLKLESEFCREFSEPYELFLTESNEPPIFSHARRGILLTTFPWTTFDEYFHHNTPEWKQNGIFSRWWLTKCQRFEWCARFASYQTVLCPSQFVRQLCWNRWQLTPQVLNPMPRAEFQPAEEKDALIVSTGNFSAKNTNRQEVLISAFQDFYDKMVVRFELEENWRLCLMGSCSDSPEDLAFVEKLRKKAWGYPVEILTNVDHQTLENTMSRATFFWSANGYEWNEKDSPECVDSFAISALEAQAAGVVPMIFHAGSAAEVVHHGMNGFLWSTFRELVETTTAILVEKRILPILETGALKNAEKFSEAVFRERLKKFI